jgi:predicted phosphodiesterase
MGNGGYFFDEVYLRIGFIADTHDEQYGLMKRAVALMCEDKPIDYLFHLGDFLHNFSGRPGTGNNPYIPYRTAARRLYEIVEEFGLKGASIIPGNHEIMHPEKGLCELEALSLHEKTIKIKGYNFLGYGGGFNFVQMKGWNFFDNQRYRCNPEKLKDLLEENDVDILLLHQLETKSRRKSLRKVIEDSGVKIVISGHTHSHGVEFYGKPIYASCGPIWPLDERSHYPKSRGKSSYGILEIKDNIAKVSLYFFSKDKELKRDVSELDAEIEINFNNY